MEMIADYKEAHSILPMLIAMIAGAIALLVIGRWRLFAIFHSAGRFVLSFMKSKYCGPAAKRE